MLCFFVVFGIVLAGGLIIFVREGPGMLSRYSEQWQHTSEPPTSTSCGRQPCGGGPPRGFGVVPGRAGWSVGTSEQEAARGRLRDADARRLGGEGPHRALPGLDLTGVPPSARFSLPRPEPPPRAFPSGPCSAGTRQLRGQTYCSGQNQSLLVPRAHPMSPPWDWRFP